MNFGQAIELLKQEVLDDLFEQKYNLQFLL